MIKTINDLKKRFKKDVNKMQKKCKHKNTFWRMDRLPFIETQYCKNCGKILKEEMISLVK